MRILLIEDEPGIAEFVEKALHAHGHQVDLCGDGLEGEHRALMSDVDLVILDRMLPGREGVEVLRGIRAVKPELPVIMLSARGEIHEKVEVYVGYLRRKLALPGSPAPLDTIRSAGYRLSVH